MTRLTMGAAELSTLLLIEDDAAFAAGVTRAFAASGITVWHAESASDARVILKHGQPDLILLDLTLPDVDGLVFCTHLKAEAPGVPIMICSAATTAEKVLAFKLGADDVIAKPVELAELEARVEACLRRRAAPPAEVSATPDSRSGLGTMHVDVARWRVSLDDRPLDLTPTEFQLLVFMARRPGEIISRTELARGVWGDESMSQSRTIDAYVRRVSAKLSGAHGPSRDDGIPRILCIRGLGYQLAVPVAAAA